MISMLIVGALSIYIFLAAPGNAARLDGNPMSRNIGFSVISSFKQLAILSFPLDIQNTIIDLFSGLGDCTFKDICWRPQLLFDAGLVCCFAFYWCIGRPDISFLLWYWN